MDWTTLRCISFQNDTAMQLVYLNGVFDLYRSLTFCSLEHGVTSAQLGTVHAAPIVQYICAGMCSRQSILGV